MKNIISITLPFFFVVSSVAQTKIFDSLLQTHVDENGNVNYANLKKEETKLDIYIEYLTKTSPGKNWSPKKEKSFWVNAYNAYTVRLILDNYPLKSILEIKQNGKDAWNIPFAKIGETSYTLNHIEHEILRKKFNDPKIHVAVNCASKSCPKLGNFAFTEVNYETKTSALMKEFINDTSRNKITDKKAKLSKIFEWFSSDFTKKGSIIDFLNSYSTIKINKKAKISFLEYDWNLNQK